MRTSDLFKLALVHLSRRKSRTFLTVLGVIVGTACIVLMLSIGYSNYKQFEGLLTNNTALTRIEINDYSSSAVSGRGGITDSTVQSIAAMEHVEAASPVVQVPAVIRTGAYEANISVTGIEPAVLDLELEEGGMFGQGGTMPVLVVGGDAVQQFVDPKNPPNYADWEEFSKYSPQIDWLGTELELQFGYGMDDPEAPRGSLYRASVSGLTKKAQSSESNSIYMDLAVAKRMLMDNRELADDMGVPLNSYQQVIVRVDDMDNVQSVMDEIKKLGYQTYSETEYISQMQEEQGRQQGQLFAIGLISLLVAGAVIPSNIPVIIICGLFYKFGSGLTLGATTVMLADVIDYGEVKLGTRNESIVASFQMLLVKTASAVAGWLIGVGLTISGYVENVAQTGTTILGMRILMGVVPSIITVLAFVIYVRGYKLEGSFLENINAQLKASRQNNNSVPTGNGTPFCGRGFRFFADIPTPKLSRASCAACFDSPASASGASLGIITKKTEG